MRSMKNFLEVNMWILDKPLLWKSLIAEQHGICSYCMRQIIDNANMTIEHWKTIDLNADGAIDYENMFRVFNGWRKAGKVDAERSRRVLCCDVSKWNMEIT